jgi:Ca2+-binding EF-hand superfamily protein
MRKRNDELSFTDSIENAIDMVATFDTDGDAKLDHDEFKHYVDVMLKELGVTFTEFSEFLVIQILFADDKESEEELQLARDDINKEVKAREVLFDMLSDERMVELFQLFDKDGTGELTFKEVAIGLYQMTQNVEESTRTAMNLLLMMDKNDKRTLSYEQFGRLIMAIVAAGNTTFDEIADDLTLAVTSNDTICEEDLETLIVAETIFQKSKDLEEGSRRGEVDALSYGRLKRLFSLWDIDGDGDITLTELTEGLRMFQAAAGIEGDAEREAQALLGFDSDGDQRLDPREFSHAMVHYAKEFGIDLHELIDFMCVTSVMGEKNTQGFQEAYGKALTSDDYGKKVKPNNEQYYVGEGDVDFYD